MFHHYHYHYHGQNDKDPKKNDEWILPYGPEPEWPIEYKEMQKNSKNINFFNISKPNQKNQIDFRNKMIHSNPI